MKTITVRANEISQPFYAGAGSRITLTGSGRVEWAAVEKLQDALNGATWNTWPAGSTAGYRDTDRGMAIRVVGTGACSVTIEEGKGDPANENAYWQPVGDGVSAITNTLTGEIEIYGPDGRRIIGKTEARAGSRLVPGKAWLRQPSALPAGVGFGGSMTGTVVTRRGKKCIELTSPANASIQGFWFPIPAGVVTSKQHVTYEVESAEEWRGGNHRVGFYTSGAFSQGMRALYTMDSYNGFDGVRCLAPLASEWAAVGAGSFSDSMTYCYLQFVRKSGATAPTKIWIYDIAEAEKNTVPSIVIGADDGAKSWYTDGLPLCDKYGFSSYLAFIADERGTATRMSQAEWADAIGRGHHAVVHGCKSGVSSLADYFSSHPGYASPGDAIYADITYNRDIMIAEGLDPDGLGRRLYMLPQGKHQPNITTASDATILTAMQSAGMVAGRLARPQGSLMANGGWSGSSFFLPILGHAYAGGSEAANISALVAAMQDEIAAGRSVVFMFHEVRASPTANEHITAANLETIIAAADVLVRSGAARRGRLTDLAGEVLTYASPL